MDDIDISREACEDHADYCRGFGPSTTPDMILALRAALDRAEADIADLKHDLARYITIAGEEATRAERAEADKAAEVQALVDAASPLMNLAVWFENAKPDDLVILNHRTVSAIRAALAPFTGANP